MQAEHARETDFPELKTFWKEVFGDTDAYIELFFSEKSTTENAFIIRENSEIAAMAFSLNAPLLLESGEEIKAAYLCGIATKTAYRNQGMAGELIKACCAEAKQAGAEACYLIPAEQSLFSYYARFGFFAKTFMCIKEYPAAKGEIPVFDRRFQPEKMQQFYDEWKLPFKPQRSGADFRAIYQCYDEVLLFEQGYMVLGSEQDTLVILEQTFDGIKIGQELAFEKGKTKLKVFVPSNEGAGTPFAAVKFLGTQKQHYELENGYIQLMLN